MKDVQEVRDRTADTWIKAIGVIIIPLIGVIGMLFLGNQEKTFQAVNRTNEALHEINNKLNMYNALLQTHTSKISRNELDIKEVRTITIDNSKRLYTLEGAKK